MDRHHAEIQRLLAQYGYSTRHTDGKKLDLRGRVSHIKPLWVLRDQVVLRAAELDEDFNLPTGTLMFIVDHEAGRGTSDAGIFLNVKSVSPTGGYLGLTQMGQNAWEDAQKVVNLPSFKEGWANPEHSLRAAAGFAVFNMRLARSRHGYAGVFDKELIYGMHNQGHTLVSPRRAAGTVLGQQSASAVRLVQALDKRHRRS